MFAGLTKLSLKNTISVIILSVLVLIGGIYSAQKIQIETFPDVSFPAVAVQVVYPGASSEDIETEVTKPIESGLMKLENYDQLTSTSSENMASIFMIYPFGTDMDKIEKDVDNVINKTKLPDKAEATVQRIAMDSAPIYQVAIANNGQVKDLQQSIEKDLLPQIKKITGVSDVSLQGTKDEEIQIVVDNKKAEEKGISLDTIKTAIQGLDYAVPLGSVENNGKTVSVRMKGTLNSVDQIKKTVLSSAAAQSTQMGTMTQGAQLGRGAGQAQTVTPKNVTVADIADVKVVSVQDQISRYNGKESYILSVSQTQDSNTADVATSVKKEIKSFKKDNNVETHVIMDNGKEIEKSVSSLIKEGLLGALFTVVVILLFLRNIRATIISILSLPISIFATISVLNSLGYTLNIMTLGGLVVAIGRIVDDSIVVIENIYRWKQQKGNQYKKKEMALYATKEVIGAIASSTFATVVVFLPLAFVSGIIGEFFRPFAISVVVSILTSLIVAIILIPTLGAKFLSKPLKEHSNDTRFMRGYEKLLRSALKRKWIVILLSIVLLAGSLSMIPLLGFSFLPGSVNKTLQVTATLPSNSTVDQSNVVAKELEKYFANSDKIDSVQATVGGKRDFMMNMDGGKNKAIFQINLKDGKNMDKELSKINKEVPSIVDAKVKGTTITAKELSQNGPPTGNNIDVNLYSANFNDLKDAASKIEKELNSDDRLKNVSNNLKDVQPKLEITLNDKARDENISMFQVMGAINEKINDVEIGDYDLNGETNKLTVGYKTKATSKEDIEKIKFMTATGPKEIKDYVTISKKDAPVSINHDDGKMFASVSAEVKGKDTAAITKDVTSHLNKIDLPKSVDMKIGGGLDMISDGFSSLGIAMVVAVGLVFLIMSMTFGGLRTPFVILTSLIFVPVGAFLALFIGKQTLSMSAMIGLLMLIGIVVTNAVVLLDRVEHNRKNGLEVTDALIEASKTRLRPILMTALATILALVPMALSNSTSGLISKGLAVTVIGGLTTSTFLTLIIIPVIYKLVSKKKKIEE
ncbi:MULTISPECIES: efflux RND transporter permease subunit [unclassified Bacillus (in: firmicutes)]|uniref:efflux RND transporter permease subunit n=1 Tax=unclassified Bacillus (in: firmicutes) TaxID=185979 RepID=UPI0008EA8853|nr:MULTISPECIES: efflux RND transporter permease subunit [unclassified Bacillus (in: firmicutes)]PGZ93173.1 AcrB/AcrD/AcrF family protein [Bacillus sp. AFS029533]SFD34578.1 Multidrug efflux pump subunit AcrB [Bacillus sp. UNCCL81]